MYATGGGLATLDCDEDGRPDLYVAGGAGPAALYRNTSPTGGALRFARIADASTDMTGVLGAYPLDVDGDGHADLAVLRAGETVLLRGLGGCRFERANEAWGFDGGTNADTTAFSATWEGANAFPTLALGRYLKLDAQGDQTLDCDTSLLVRPAASGAGYGAATELAPGYCPLSMLFSDWDGSGRRDLRVTNDRNYYRDGTDQLWRIAPGEAPHAYTTDEGWIPLQVSGMGIGEADVSGSGYPDYVITSQGDNKVQALKAGPAQPSYRDIANRLGADGCPAVVRRRDAAVDRVASRARRRERRRLHGPPPDQGERLGRAGLRDEGPERPLPRPADRVLGPGGRGGGDRGLRPRARGVGRGLQPRRPPRSRGGLLRRPGQGLAQRGVRATPSTPKAMGHWLELRLSQPAPNPDAIGAWVEVKIGETTLRREVTVGGGHASGALGWLHFGLGPSTKAQVRVQWPDGTWGPWADVAADGFYDIERGSAGPRAWTPPAS